MMPETLYKKILRRFAQGGTHIELANDCIKLIEKCEAEAYIKGFKNACNATREYLNESI